MDLDLVHQITRYIHVGGGFLGLFLFWIPIFSKKGGKIHRSIGKIWVWLARVIIVAALAGLLMYLPKLLSQGKTFASNPNDYAFIVFLGYLSIVTIIVVNYAVVVLNSKNNPQIMSNLTWKLLSYISLFASAFIVFYALMYQPKMQIVLFALSPIGFGTGYGMLKYISGKYPSKKQWLYEHLGSMLGAGIAFHTAFAVFGASRIFDIGLEGWMAAIPWILPAAIGIPASIGWTRHYQKKFKEI